MYDLSNIASIFSVDGLITFVVTVSDFISDKTSNIYSYLKVKFNQLLSSHNISTDHETERYHKVIEHHKEIPHYDHRGELHNYDHKIHHSGPKIVYNDTPTQSEYNLWYYILVSASAGFLAYAYWKAVVEDLI